MTSVKVTEMPKILYLFLIILPNFIYVEADLQMLLDLSHKQIGQDVTEKRLLIPLGDSTEYIV